MHRIQTVVYHLCEGCVRAVHPAHVQDLRPLELAVPMRVMVCVTVRASVLGVMACTMVCATVLGVLVCKIIVRVSVRARPAAG